MLLERATRDYGGGVEFGPEADDIQGRRLEAADKRRQYRLTGQGGNKTREPKTWGTGAVGSKMHEQQSREREATTEHE